MRVKEGKVWKSFLSQCLAVFSSVKRHKQQERKEWKKGNFTFARSSRKGKQRFPLILQLYYNHSLSCPFAATKSELKLHFNWILIQTRFGFGFRCGFQFRCWCCSCSCFYIEKVKASALRLPQLCHSGCRCVTRRPIWRVGRSRIDKIIFKSELQRSSSNLQLLLYSAGCCLLVVARYLLVLSTLLLPPIGSCNSAPFLLGDCQFNIAA